MGVYKKWDGVCEHSGGRGEGDSGEGWGRFVVKDLLKYYPPLQMEVNS